MQKCTLKMLDVTKTVNVADRVKNIDVSNCSNTESLLLTKLWNDDDDIMGLLQQRVSKRIVSWHNDTPPGCCTTPLIRSILGLGRSLQPIFFTRDQGPLLDPSGNIKYTKTRPVEV